MTRDEIRAALGTRPSVAEAGYKLLFVRREELLATALEGVHPWADTSLPGQKVLWETTGERQGEPQR